MKKKLLTKSSLCVCERRNYSEAKYSSIKAEFFWGLPKNFEECKYLEHDKQIITTAAAADKKHYRCMSEYRKTLWIYGCLGPGVFV